MAKNNTNDGVTNVLMVGVGGQGIILASELLSESALIAGYDIKKSEVHGMAQRGGSVSSHVRFGKKVLSPLIERGAADYLLAFEKAEALRNIDMVKPGGTVIVADAEIVPTTVSIGLSEYPDDIDDRLKGMDIKLETIKAVDIAQKAGSIKTANVAMLASLAKHIDIEEKEFKDVMEWRVPDRFIEINMKAWDMGYKASSA